MIRKSDHASIVTMPEKPNLQAKITNLSNSFTIVKHLEFLRNANNISRQSIAPAHFQNSLGMTNQASMDI